MKTHGRVVVLMGAILSVICARAAGAGPTGISRYELRLDPEAEGPARATLSLAFDRLEGETAVIPFPFAEINDLRLGDAPPDTRVSTTSTKGPARILVIFPANPTTPFNLRLTCDVQNVLSEPTPAGRTVRVALLNTEPEPIRDLSISITFPEGLRGHAIREARPAPGQAEGGPRAVLDAIDGRSGARLHVDSLSQGETAALRIELARAEPSMAWLLAGLVLGALYLVSFRDLVRPPPT